MSAHANYFSDKSVAKMVELYRRNVITLQELANQLIDLTDLDDIQSFVDRLPRDVVQAIQTRLAELPTNDDQWAGYWVPMLDGSDETQGIEKSRLRFIVENLRRVLSARIG
jgi:hypothetical protein